MVDLVQKLRRRRNDSIVLAATRRLSSACSNLLRGLRRSVRSWHPGENDKIELIACATLLRALGYCDIGYRLSHQRTDRTDQALDLIRTALEHSYVLAIVSQEGKPGLDFVVDWEKRMRVSKMRRLLASNQGDPEDRAEIQSAVNQMLEELGTTKVAQATVHDLVERANLQNTHVHVYSRLNPFSHFDTAAVLESAYTRLGMIEERYEESTLEKKCETVHSLLIALLHLAVGRRDFGDATLNVAIEKGFVILRETEAIALQVAE